MPHYRPLFNGLTDGIAVGDTIIIMKTGIAIAIMMGMTRGVMMIGTQKSQPIQLLFINL